MSDYLVRGMSMDGFVKVVAICSTETVRRAAQIHGTTPNATAAFGRALTAASMMGNMQKVDNGSMTLQIRGGGPIGTITCVSDAQGNVRGCMTEPQLTGYLKAAGFIHIEVYADRRFEAPREGEQRIYFKARKGRIK